MKYILITPARNEARVIEHALKSMVAQTVYPERWVVVDDGSTDRTAEIVESYLKRHSWISLVRRPQRANRDFAGKVHAFAAGLESIRSVDFDLIGNLDADISFGPDHFEFLIQQFRRDPNLGVAGTAYTESNWDSTADSFEGETSVHGACQLFRHQCFKDIGGYQPNPAGGIDWIAVTTARMKGWTTRNFAERKFYHHRQMGTAQRSVLGAMFDYGAKDHFLGGSPVWEIFRVAYRMTKKPIFFGGVALMLGYSWSAFSQSKRPVSKELMRFHRREQMARLKTIFRSVIRLKKVEKFYTGNLPKPTVAQNQDQP